MDRSGDSGGGGGDADGDGNANADGGERDDDDGDAAESDSECAKGRALGADECEARRGGGESNAIERATGAGSVRDADAMGLCGIRLFTPPARARADTPSPALPLLSH